MPEPSAEAIRYHQTGNVLWVVDTGFGLLLPALLLFTGISARLRTWARGIGRKWLPAVVLYGLMFTAVTALIAFPLSYYEGFVRQHAYGLSNQTLEKWLTDWLKGVAISGVGLSLVLWIPYLLLRQSPRRWWLYTGLATIPIASFTLIIAPVWIDPMFNRFTPLRDRGMEQRILHLAEQAGISHSRIYRVDKSVDTKTVNAYVTGLGTTKRIVLWDTLLKKLTPDEVAFVVAHEMGHFVLRHALAYILLATVSVTAALLMIHLVALRLIRRLADRFRFDQLSDVASFPLLLLLAGALSFIATPAVLAFSRHQEHEADRFALELTKDNRAGASTFVRLQEENLAVPRPSPIFVLWRASQPPQGERVDFANSYHPWDCGLPLRYGRLFR